MYVVFLLLLGFFCSWFAFKPLINVLREMQMGQYIHDKVLWHSSKQGTTTMGGLLINGLLFLYCLGYGYFFQQSFLLSLTLLILSFCLLGFVDDYLKITRSANSQGLSKSTKLIFQTLLAWVFYQSISSDLLLSEVYVPFFGLWIDFGLGYVFWFIFVLVSSANAANLTDGLDGLLVSQMVGIFLFLFVFVAFYTTGHDGVFDFFHIDFSHDVFLGFFMWSIGVLIGFWWYNTHPAVIFMGDVGSMTLGALIGALFLFYKIELLLPLVASVMVFEVLSVILQVFWIRVYGRKLFNMAPVHHHFEMMGYGENTIVLSAGFMLFISGLLSLYLL